MTQKAQDPLLVSASGLTAQRLRLDLIAGNLANAGTTRTERGEPYRKKMPLVEAIVAKESPFAFWARLRSFLGRVAPLSVEGNGPEGGVRVSDIVNDTSPFPLKYEPGHPDADDEGYVMYPNVDPIAEMVDLIAAQRAYEANAACVDATKRMISKALDIGRM